MDRSVLIKKRVAVGTCGSSVNKPQMHAEPRVQ